MIRDDFAPCNEVYASLSFYIDELWSQDVGSDVMVAKLVGSTASQRIWLHATPSGLLLRGYLGGVGTHPIVNGVWHSLEVRVRTGNGDALTTIWLDGKKDIEATGPMISGTLNLIYVGADPTKTTTAGRISFDDVVVSKAPEGSPSACITVRHPNTASRSGMPVDVTLFGVDKGDRLVASVDGTVTYRTLRVLDKRERFPST